MLTHHEMRRMMSETQRARVQNVVSTCRKHQEAQRFTIVTSAMKQKASLPASSVLTNPMQHSPSIMQ